MQEGARNALAELLPELGGTGTRADAEPSARQGRLFEAMLSLLERLGRAAPVLLAIEDLHRADGATRDFITFLVRSAREEPLCLVVTYRSDELHRGHPLRPLLAELEHAAGVDRIALERFDRGELAEQLEGILHEPAPTALAERLFGRSQGNPPIRCSSSAPGMYGFRHALVGEAVHNDLLPGEDTALHSRIAATLEDGPDLLGDVSEATVAAELACHWRAAHELPRSLGASVRAGIAAKRVYAYEEGGRQFERALELWAGVPDAADRAGMDPRRGAAPRRHCATARGEASRSVALIREALAALDADAEPLRAAALHLRLGHSLGQAGAGRESFAAFDRAVELLSSGPSAERARVCSRSARALRC